MLENFRLQFAKIFAIVAISLVIIIGLASKIAFQLILIRAIIGGGLFSLIGYLLGLILDKEQEKAQMKPEQELIKTQLKHPYQNVIGSTAKVSNQDFTPLDTENLAKIVVDSLDE